MSNKATEDLPLSDAITGDEIAALVQGGNSRRNTLKQIVRRSTGMGWKNFVDAATVLEANAIALTANVRTQYTVDGGAGSEIVYGANSGIVWTANKQTGAVLGDSFTWKAIFNAKKSGGAVLYLLIEREIEGVPYGSHEVALRVDSPTYPHSLMFVGFADAAMVANGTKFYITASANCSIWGKQLFIRRDYAN